MTDDNDLLQSIHKDIQREKWLAFWNRYALIIITSLVIATLSGAAFGYWLFKSHSFQNQASSELLKALYFVDTPDANEEHWNELQTFLESEYAQWPLHSLSSTITLANHYAKKNEYQKLLALLNKTPPTDIPYYDNLIILWKGKAHALNGEYNKATQLLQPLSHGSLAWRYIALEWLAEIAVASNDISAAKLHLQTISDDLQAPPVLRQRASRMLKVLS
jgi:hypothetical protein